MHAATLFVADLHLEAARPDITALFVEYLHQKALCARALYILGDLFEAWIGDDDDAAPAPMVIAALRSLTDAGVPVYFLAGNRDFLIGERFATQTGVQLLPDSTVIEVNGERVLLLHGDTLCTDDVTYQIFRAQVRTPAWQAQMLTLPLAQRRALATQLREKSQQATAQKSAAITDANQITVDTVMRAHNVNHLIHGHTHRPAIHAWLCDDQPMRRAVLGDWYTQGSVLVSDHHGWRLETLPLRSGAVQSPPPPF